MPAINKKPPNNRVFTGAALKTSDIWSKTIGHDPYASASDERETAKLSEERAKSLLELARHQNAATYSQKSQDEYARKMFLGLKGGKKLRASDDVEVEDGARKNALRLLEQEESSSSEEEYIHITNEDSAKRRGKDDKESSSSADESRDRSEKKHKKRKNKERERKRRREKKRKRYSSSSSDSSATSYSRSNDTSDDSSAHQRHRKKKKDHKR